MTVTIMATNCFECSDGSILLHIVNPEYLILFRFPGRFDIPYDPEVAIIVEGQHQRLAVLLMLGIDLFQSIAGIDNMTAFSLHQQ